MTEHLIENDSKNASTYKSNLDKALNDIDKLTMDVMTELNQSTSSIVFMMPINILKKDLM